MAMLPAPIIEGTLPAFYDDNLTIPFMMSRAVSETEIKGFQIKIKSIYQSSAIIENLDASNYSISDGIATFKVNTDNYKQGSFYKVQMAYVGKDSGLPGFYSTVGVIKYTTKPELSILGLDAGENNAHIYNYTGTYSQEGKDTSEKEYSYRFVIKDENDNTVEDTGFLIHNSSTNVDHYQSSDEFYYPIDLIQNKRYTIQYFVRTNNGLEVSTQKYRLTSKKTAITTLKTSINVVNNYENGYIEISLQGDLDDSGNETLAIGSFKVLRASEKYDFQDWKEIFDFNLINQPPSIKTWKDYTVEQGVTYKYAIQQYNNKGIYSDKILSKIVYADFEDSFLFDGEKQLKIRYNPKVSSFKHTLLESKMDTLGSKYPFIFRNGNVGYKEFPINGLLSYHMDDQSQFFDNKKLYDYDFRNNTGKLVGLKDYPDKNTFLNNCHIYYIKIIDENGVEKYSKLDPSVNWQEFYDNGTFKDLYIKNKIYTNVNLEWAINNNFSYASTDLNSLNYQIERDFKLEVLDWLNNGQPKLFRSPAEGNYIVRLMNVSLTPNDTLGRMLHTFQATAYEIANNIYEKQVEYNFIKTSENNAISEESSYFKIIYSDFNDPNRPKLPDGKTFEYFKLQDIQPGTKFSFKFANVNQQSVDIVIGSTGTYIAQLPVQMISLPAGGVSKGSFVAGYYEQMQNEDHFEGIVDIGYGDMVSQQIIGKHINIMDEIQSDTLKISNFNKIRFYKRPIIPQSEQAYYPLQLKEMEDGRIYDPSNKKYYNKDEIDYTIKLDDIDLNLVNIPYLEHNNFDIVPKTFYMGAGVYAELFYSYQILTFQKKE